MGLASAAQSEFGAHVRVSLRTTAALWPVGSVQGGAVVMD